MAMEILTQDDLKRFKTEFFIEFFNVLEEKFETIKQELTESKPKSEKSKFIKSAQVLKLLKIAPSTLYLKRIHGEIPYTKIGNTIFYDETDILELLKNNKNFRVSEE